MEGQNTDLKGDNANKLLTSVTDEQLHNPPSYALSLPPATTDDDRGYPADSKETYTKNGANARPVFDQSPANGADVERGFRAKRLVNLIFPCARVYRSTKGRYGTVPAVAAFVAVLLVLVGAVGGITFGIIVSVEKGLTGELFWQPRHGELFRICESDSTSTKLFQSHTCNVFRPGYDLDAAPMHAFAEEVRLWSSGPGSQISGRAQRIAPIQLESLLFRYGLKCNRPKNSPAPPLAALGEDTQIIIGGVGQFLKKEKYATACNYFEDASLAAPSCAIYSDGGVRSTGKVWPKSISQIMTERFGMTCEWAA